MGDRGLLCQGIQFAITDMLPAYLKVLRERAPATLNILDRFHISKKFGEALDKVRAEETRQLEEDGYEPILKHSRWCLLKRHENLTSKQTVKLRDWCVRANQSQIEPMQKMAATLLKHEPLLLNWFESKGLSWAVKRLPLT